MRKKILAGLILALTVTGCGSQVEPTLTVEPVTQEQTEGTEDVIEEEPEVVEETPEILDVDNIIGISDDFSVSIVDFNTGEQVGHYQYYGDYYGETLYDYEEETVVDDGIEYTGMAVSNRYEFYYVGDAMYWHSDDEYLIAYVNIYDIVDRPAKDRTDVLPNISSKVIKADKLDSSEYGEDITEYEIETIDGKEYHYILDSNGNVYYIINETDNMFYIVTEYLEGISYATVETSATESTVSEIIERLESVRGE